MSGHMLGEAVRLGFRMICEEHNTARTVQGKKDPDTWGHLVRGEETFWCVKTLPKKED